MATDDPTFEPKDEAGKKGAGKSRRRPPPTLDLAATEVKAAGDESTVPAGPSATTSAPVTSDMDAMPGENAGVPPQDADSTSETPPPEAAASEAGRPEGASAGSDEAGAPDSDAARSDAPEAEAPVSPAPRRQLGMFGVAVAALISGVVGGAVAFTVASTFYGAEQSLDSLTDLEVRALDLRQRVEAIEAREKRASASSAAAPADLAARLAALESGLDALGKKVDAQAGSPAATPGAVTALGNRVDALQQRVNAIPPPAETVSPEALAATTARVDALEQKLSTVAATQQARGQGPSQIIALDALREAVLDGRPFATELKVAQALLGPDSTALEDLAPMAANGFASGTELAAQLKAEASPPPSEPTAPAASPDDGVFDRLMKSAQGLVSVSHNGEAPASLDEAEAALKRGDFEAALVALQALPEATRTRVQTVIATVETRQTALGLLAGLKSRILGTLGGGAK
ncbi:COG4223 family protein [Ancylobacter pratisalsi]|uniref:Mitochondrial inner membrane protein n=1 Tax=Ancylobacter pratisalsi TaxID=1745854 RepID=A0A6P1YJD6_9HYPH|nr:hypothetical protein [Ancylobacter pratisalsi]QIB33262.1 hypothetical protein G3A50_05715 [Ancylobacter pratisalsi]